MWGGEEDHNSVATSSDARTTIVIVYYYCHTIYKSKYSKKEVISENEHNGCYGYVCTCLVVIQGPGSQSRLHEKIKRN